MDNVYDAIIIGAGPAGSSAAILLARAGWQVALVEKQQFPRRKVCGECIAASNLPLLDGLGVGNVFTELAGPPLRRVALMAGDRIVQADLPPYPHGKQPWGVTLGRETLDSLLLAQAVAHGVTLFQPWVVRKMAGAPGRYFCHVAKVHTTESRVLAAPVLIAANGSWEPSPLDGRARAPQRAQDLFAFKTNFTQTHLPRGLLPVLSFSGGYGGIVFGDRATTTLAFCIRRDTLEECRKITVGCKAGEAALAHVRRSCPALQPILLNARQHDTWLSVGPIRPDVRITLQNTGAFVIGNAAGESHPIIGEGISMAIQSAWLLAERLAPHRKRGADLALQRWIHREYAAAWQRHFRSRIRIAALFAHVAMRPALVDCVMPLLQRYPQLLTHAATWSGKVRSPPLQNLEANRLHDVNKWPA